MFSTSTKYSIPAQVVNQASHDNTNVEKQEVTVQAKDVTAQVYQIVQLDDYGGDDDDDEFGDNDLDEDLLVQVEMKATQAFRASHLQSKTSFVKNR